MRSYDQYCGLAAALDMVGERWTLLIVRELTTGPKRYTDLAANLPGIGTSLLAARLKALENQGLVRRRALPPPAASTVYDLSGSGAELGEALRPLIQWGLRHALPEHPRDTDHLRATWSLLPFVQMPEETLANLEGSYRVEVGDSVATLRIHDSHAEVIAGEPVAAPDLMIRLDADVIPDVGTGRLSVRDAVAAGRITVDGDPVAALALIEALDGQRNDEPAQAGTGSPVLTPSS